MGETRPYRECGYSRVWTEKDYERAIQAAAGRYQAALINGQEAWSGATLRGKAKEYGSRYKMSRNSLLSRLRQAGVQAAIVRGPRGKLILVIGGPPQVADYEETGDAPQPG